MADLTSAGRVQSRDQIRDNRQRKGLCGTCQNDDPVQCYSIKKRIGGIFKERIPLTEEGKVYNGVCLACNPHLDPRTRAQLMDPLTSNVEFERDARDSREDHRRQSGENAQQGNELPHTASMLNNIVRRPTRQANFQLSKSLPLDVGRQHRLPRFADDPRMQQQEQQHQDQDNAYEIERRNWRIPKPHTEAGHTDQDANLGNVSASSQFSKKNDSPYGHHHRTQQSYGQKTEEQAPEYNVKFPTYSPQYSQSQPSGREMNSNDGVHQNIPSAQDSEQNRSAYEHRQREDMGAPFFLNRGNFSNSNLQDDVQSDSHHPRGSNRYPSAYDHRRGEEMEDRKLPSVPDFSRRGNLSNLNLENNVRSDSHHPRDSDRNHSGHERWGGDEIEDRRLPSDPNSANRIDTSSSSVEGDAHQDNLTRLIATYLSQNTGVRKFVPCSSGIVFPYSELQLDDIEDVESVLTLDTHFREMGSVATMGTRKKAASQRTLGAIDESSSSSSSGKRSMISHQIHEPAIPHAAAVPAQDMESYLNNATPDLKNLSEFVEMCNTTGLDEEAINALKMALIHDNGTTRSKDLAIFCLTKLLVLARKSDDNKRMMIVDDIDGAGAYSAFDAIIEAAQIYRESAEIQQEVCAVLWSLSIKYQKHIAQNGGCNAILDAMTVHMADYTLQDTALGALNVISLDSVGQWTLSSRGGMAIVTQVMQTHVYYPAILSRGCVILGKLTVDEVGQYTTVGEKEVDVIIKGMLAHPNSLEVQEAA